MVAEQVGFQEGGVGLQEGKDGRAVSLGLRLQGPPGEQGQVAAGVLGVAGPEQGQGLGGGQALGAGEDLRPHLGVRFAARQPGQGVTTHLPAFAEHLHRPAADVGIAMLQRCRLVWTQCVERPQRLQGLRAIQHRFQLRREFGQPAPADLQHRLLAEPFVGVAKVTEQLLAAGLAQVEGLELRRAARGPNAVDATAGFVPVVDRPHVAEAGVVPVGHVEAAVGADPGPDRAEPAVG